MKYKIVTFVNSMVAVVNADIDEVKESSNGDLYVDRDDDIHYVVLNPTAAIPHVWGARYGYTLFGASRDVLMPSDSEVMKDVTRKTVTTETGTYRSDGFAASDVDVLKDIIKAIFCENGVVNPFVLDRLNDPAFEDFVALLNDNAVTKDGLKGVDAIFYQGIVE